MFCNILIKIAELVYQNFRNYNTTLNKLHERTYDDSMYTLIAP